MSKRRIYIKRLMAASIVILLMLIMGLTISSDASIIKEIIPAPYGPNAPHPQKHQTLARLARGKFLVAKRGMKDRRFAQTVILIFEHSEQGAGGLIINRPTSITVKEAFPAIDTGRIAAGNVYIGGPVDSNTIFMLIRANELPEGTLHVVGDIYISTRPDVLRRATSDDKLAANFRVYAGYAGWGPMQLDKEMLHNDWYVTDGDDASIFDTKSEDIWPAIIAALED